MSNSSNEPVESPPPDESGSISDDQLPEDLRPTDDNPLAQNPDQGDEGVEGADDSPLTGGAEDQAGADGAPPSTP